MRIDADTPQRVAIVVEGTKSDTWSVGAYLVTADGRRERRALGVFETYEEAVDSLKKAWERVSL